MSWKLELPAARRVAGKTLKLPGNVSELPVACAGKILKLPAACAGNVLKLRGASAGQLGIPPPQAPEKFRS